MKVDAPEQNALSGSGKEDESDSGFVERLRQLTSIAGSANALARKAGISQGGLQRYLKGGEPTRKVLINLAAAMNADLVWLMTGEGSMLAGKTTTASSRDDVAGMEDYAFVPLYDAQCSAGAGAWNEGCRVLTHISFTRYSLRKQGLTPEHLSAIRIDGDSMEPVLQNGATVLIDHTRTHIEGEGIYVLRLDDHLYAKRLQRQFDGIAVISANKDYEPMHIPRDRMNDLDIIGRCVWSGGWL